MKISLIELLEVKLIEDEKCKLTDVSLVGTSLMVNNW